MYMYDTCIIYMLMHYTLNMYMTCMHIMHVYYVMYIIIYYIMYMNI
jgi:hypothetical protein